MSLFDVFALVSTKFIGLIVFIESYAAAWVLAPLPQHAIITTLD